MSYRTSLTLSQRLAHELPGPGIESIATSGRFGWSPGWRPGEEYLRSEATYESWEQFAATFPREYERVVQYYFAHGEVEITCGGCQGSGLDAERVAIEPDDFWGGSGPRWSDFLRREDLDVLVAAGVVPRFVTRENVELHLSDEPMRLLGHRRKQIAARLITEARAQEAGVIQRCHECKATGTMIEGEDRLDLHLWLISRDGTSRGATIEGVRVADLSEIQELLRNDFAGYARSLGWSMAGTPTTFPEPAGFWNSAQPHDLQGYHRSVEASYPDWQAFSAGVESVRLDLNIVADWRWGESGQSGGSELWLLMLHPRKGRTVHLCIEHFSISDLQGFQEYLRRQYVLSLEYFRWAQGRSASERGRSERERLAVRTCGAIEVDGRRAIGGPTRGQCR